MVAKVGRGEQVTRPYPVGDLTGNLTARATFAAWITDFDEEIGMILDELRSASTSSADRAARAAPAASCSACWRRSPSVHLESKRSLRRIRKRASGRRVDDDQRAQPVAQ